MIYMSTPDYYNEYLAHYGVKGMKWHKRLKGKYYRGKSKVQGALSTAKNRINGYMILPGKNENRRGYPSASNGGESLHLRYRKLSDGSRLNAGLAAGRYRAAQKKSVAKYHNSNTYVPWKDLQFRGYQSSMRSSYQGSKVKEGLAAGRKRVAKKKKK